MIVTVVPFFDFEVLPDQPLKKVMTARLKRLAEELQTIHLKELEFVEPFLADVVIYLSYNSKYTIRWRIANDVSKEVEIMVADACARLGYIYWKTATLNVFKGSDNQLK
ncbi:hypothetical protein [Pedobacter insulae]|uniref:Uncharacterized protein n=1 Tax=Pedobacter insulae TaxID=414048 RepID=A0A1I2UAA2_9SPHI|nr:hypothetical protein [Pedobacter insulae]SFG73973.1 hypothetical protein SAMN04489864_10251 [Pedobacter insulae]